MYGIKFEHFINRVRELGNERPELTNKTTALAGALFLRGVVDTPRSLEELALVRCVAPKKRKHLYKAIKDATALSFSGIMDSLGVKMTDSQASWLDELEYATRIATWASAVDLADDAVKDVGPGKIPAYLASIKNRAAKQRLIIRNK